MIRELILWLMLSAAAYRLTRFVVKDTFPPMLWIRDRLAGGWRPMTDPEWDLVRKPDVKTPWPITGEKLRWVEKSKRSPFWLGELITCPWCASAYLSGAVTLVADLTIGVQWPWLTGFAVWALAAPVAARDWP